MMQKFLLATVVSIATLVGVSQISVASATEGDPTDAQNVDQATLDLKIAAIALINLDLTIKMTTSVVAKTGLVASAQNGTDTKMALLSEENKTESADVDAGEDLTPENVASGG